MRPIFPWEYRDDSFTLKHLSFNGRIFRFGFFVHKPKILPSYFYREGLQFRKKATRILSAFISTSFC